MLRGVFQRDQPRHPFNDNAIVGQNVPAKQGSVPRVHRSWLGEIKGNLKAVGHAVCVNEFEAARFDVEPRCPTDAFHSSSRPDEIAFRLDAKLSHVSGMDHGYVGTGINEKEEIRHSPKARHRNLREDIRSPCSDPAFNQRSEDEDLRSRAHKLDDR